jgi:hypothetical protein
MAFIEFNADWNGGRDSFSFHWWVTNKQDGTALEAKDRAKLPSKATAVVYQFKAGVLPPLGADGKSDTPMRVKTKKALATKRFSRLIMEKAGRKMKEFRMNVTDIKDECDTMFVVFDAPAIGYNNTMFFARPPLSPS